VLTILDDGHGFDPERAGRRTGDGLRNMAERARALGAALTINSAQRASTTDASASGRGTELTVEMPLPLREETP
jgi:signal transduction histidine kinase